MSKLRLGDLVEVIKSDDSAFDTGDTGIIVDLTDDVDVGVNCIVDFAGNERVMDDGLWWAALSNLKLIKHKG